MKFKLIKMKKYAPFLRNAIDGYLHLQPDGGKDPGNKVASKVIV